MRKAAALLTTLSLFCAMVAGCTEHQTATKKEEVKTPGGSTTVTTKTDVEKTGDHKDK